jgi:hypothetical protein
VHNFVNNTGETVVDNALELEKNPAQVVATDNKILKNQLLIQIYPVLYVFTGLVSGAGIFVHKFNWGVFEQHALRFSRRAGGG